MAFEATLDETPALLAEGERGDAGRTHPAEHVMRFMHHLVSAARSPWDLLKYEYWSGHAQMLGAGDLVWCEPADRSYWVVIRVLEVGGEGIIVEHVTSKETLRYQAPPPKPGAFTANDFEVRRSEELLDKFAVWRKAGPLGEAKLMTKGQPLSRAQCEDWLRQHIATVNRT